MIIDFIIEDLMLNSYLQKNFHTLLEAEPVWLKQVVVCVLLMKDVQIKV